MTDELWHTFMGSIRLGYDRGLFVDLHVEQRRQVRKH